MQQLSELTFGFSTKTGGVSPEPYCLNLGLNTGDEHENVLRNRKLFFDAIDISENDVSSEAGSFYSRKILSFAATPRRMRCYVYG
ncbi:MAG: laccase domain-containing protein [Ignavibacteria bacterium]|nr:laccase domain-containing protein [Ignavibacteria bacterium]